MSFVPGPKDIPVGLSVFGGLVTEMSAADLPAGVSPDNQDVVFVPGSVAGRPALKKVLASPLAAGGISSLVPTLTYMKSFAPPGGGIFNLYLDSNGVLWEEDVVNTPGTVTSLSDLPALTAYGKSVTAFGREYIAASDAMHGVTVPMQWDGTNLDRVTQDGPGGAPTVTSVPATPVAITTITRAAGVVTVDTGSAHGLQVGYQAQITGLAALAVPGISSAVINNEDNPGIATITTVFAHGLSPGIFVSITNVIGVSVGGGIVQISRIGGIVLVQTASNHGLTPGATVNINGVTSTPGLNTSGSVASVPGSTTFTLVQVAGTTDVSPVGAGGTVVLEWPVLATQQNPIFFEVLTAPTDHIFTIQLYYSDGTWTTGDISQPWDGVFFVASIVSATSFTYTSPGFSGTDSTGSGTMTPYGQAAPGIRQCQCLFLTRNGYTTRPGPPVLVTTNGGQYISVTNLPIGPANVVARILAFTGAFGSSFFYIPVPAIINGQQVSTATQIDDNTTTSVTLDFSDPTLFASIGINIPGNDLPSQIVLDSALGFGFYADRLITWGQRNRIQNMQNMTLSGGYMPSASTVPSGWTFAGSGGSLAAGFFGFVWNVGGTLSQSMFRDTYGTPIAAANTKYLVRIWWKPSNPVTPTVTFTISSSSTSFSSTATISAAQGNSTTGLFAQTAFSSAMPASIPSDLILSITGSGASQISEISIIYAEQPYLDTILYGSYVDNPEGFDGLTGKFGPSQDTHKIMDVGIIRQTLYMLTMDPGGRLHETFDNGSTEPAGWQINQVAANCGLLSTFGLTKSQADDASAAGGEEWFAWGSSSGARIFSGDQPWKISQEIQPDWESQGPPSNIVGYPNTVCSWALNDPVSRTIYFGIPVEITVNSQSPTKVYVMTYRELDTAYQIAMSPPIHTSYSGKLIATDHVRKWTRWNLTINCAALMYRGIGQQQVVFGAGNGTYPGLNPGFGNAYTLSAAKFTDDDYGQIAPYWTSYFLVTHDEEQAYHLAGRKLLVYMAAYISGIGNIQITPYADNLLNQWASTITPIVRQLAAAPNFDIECACANAQGNRVALKFASVPISATDNTFNLQKLMIWLRQVAIMPVRGSAS